MGPADAFRADGPSVTIAMPVRNGSDFLARAIDSALAQTYPNVEIIVVDDGSDDGGATAAIARGYGDRIRFIQQENQGVSGALNTVLREMTGEYFSWLSHDDVFEPNKTAVQIAHLSRAGSPPETVLFSDYLLVDAADDVISTERFDRKSLLAHPWLAFHDGMINGCTILAPRDLMLACGGFSEEYPCTQDYRAWWILVRRARLLHVPVPLVRIRHHPGQGSRSRAALAENEAFWMSVLDETDDVEATLLDGSRERFLRRSARFLRFRSPNARAADEALRRAKAAHRDAGVSVILDLHGRAEWAERSIVSIGRQRRLPDQIVMLGGREDVSPALQALLAGLDLDVVWTGTIDEGEIARVRAGLLVASGSYIAFLRAGDTYDPAKIAEQVEAMSIHGCLISHTSYEDPTGSVVPAGCFSGRVYPEILGGTHLEFSTVMIHRVLWASGQLFCERDAPPRATWVDACSRHELLGIDAPLSSIMSVPETDDAALLSWAKSHPRHQPHGRDLARLETRASRERAVS